MGVKLPTAKWCLRYDMYLMLNIHKPTFKTVSKGFTLVELIIVIVVIGILAGVVTVSYRGIRQQAEVSVIMYDLRHLSDEMKFFYKDNDSYPRVYPAVYGDPLPDLEKVLRAAGVFEETRSTNLKKTFIFCAPTRANPQRFAIIGREFGETETNTSNPILHYVTSEHASGDTPMVWTDAITAADPNGKYGSNACNTISLKTGVSYFATGNMRWSFDVPQIGN